MIDSLEGRMGSLGLPEIAFILVLALLIFGPKKLPEIGRTLGKGVSEFRRATDELKRSINTELALDEAPTPPALRTRRLEEPVEPIAAAAATATPAMMTEAALPLSTPAERHEVPAAPYEAPAQTQARTGMTSFPPPVPAEAAEVAEAAEITEPAVAAQAANAADLTGAAPAAPALPASPELPEPR
jgi:sec-independent protein translocase protein TatA